MKKNVIIVTMVAAFMLAAPLLCIDMSTSEGADDKLWTDYCDYSWYDGTGSYEIDSAEKLAGVAYLVNVGIEWLGFALPATTFQSETIALTKSVDLSAHLWDPIGFIDPDSDDAQEYQRFFRGAFIASPGVEITGLTIKNSEKLGIGLFGYIGEGSSVENVTLKDVDISGSVYAGGIAGVSYGGTIENCHVVSGTIDGEYFAGGIVSGLSNSYDSVHHVAYDGYVRNSSNKADVSSAYFTGGIVGYMPEAENEFSCWISASYNFGDVVARGGDELDTAYAGGIIGNCVNGFVSKSYNAGSVSIEGPSGSAGGIAGFLQRMDDSSDINDTAIINSYNTGVISGGNNAGGIIGDSDGSVIVIRCYNAGKITGLENFGPIFGTENAAVSNTYWLADSTSARNGARALADMTGANAMDNMSGLDYPENPNPDAPVTQFVSTALDSYAPQLICFTESTSDVVKADSLASVDLTSASPYNGDNVPTDDDDGSGNGDGDDDLLLYAGIAAVVAVVVVSVVYVVFIRKP